MAKHTDYHDQFVAAMSYNAQRLRQGIIAYRRDWVSALALYER
jgi:hypothetical protein